MQHSDFKAIDSRPRVFIDREDNSVHRSRFVIGYPLLLLRPSRRPASRGSDGRDAHVALARAAVRLPSWPVLTTYFSRTLSGDLSKDYHPLQSIDVSPLPLYVFLYTPALRAEGMYRHQQYALMHSRNFQQVHKIHKSPDGWSTRFGRCLRFHFRRASAGRSCSNVPLQSFYSI